MEILQQMMVNMLSRGELTVVLSTEAVQYLDHKCALALEQIKQIISDDTLDDPECFQRIESIVCVLEGNGIDCGTRHDFG